MNRQRERQIAVKRMLDDFWRVASQWQNELVPTGQEAVWCGRVRQSLEMALEPYRGDLVPRSAVVAVGLFPNAGWTLNIDVFDPQNRDWALGE